MKAKTPMNLFYDNKAVITISQNPVQSDRTKHVKVDKHFIKGMLENGTIYMPYVPTKNQLADTFTISLQKQVFEGLISKLGLYDMHILA